jgi:hypothetical protein
MVPPPLPVTRNKIERRTAAPALSGWVRGVLLGIAAGLGIVFGIAAWLNPYALDGQARTMETHRQLGLPPCTFKDFTGLPCPSCGMTTSFALLVRGDVVNSARANVVGTLLAALCLAYIPWSLASVVWKRPLFIVSMERALFIIVVGFVSLMMLRWFIVIGLMSWNSR